MRTNIIIDDTLLDEAMRAGPYKTKKDAVEAGLKLLARRAAYHDILALRGKLQWDEPEAKARAYRVAEPAAAYRLKSASNAPSSKPAPRTAKKSKSGK
jgi:Arc/MetJ family transcription regulator